jgi:hypothetical protein
MAEPKTEIDRRLDRHEKAIDTMAHWLTQVPGAFGTADYEGIRAILDGTETTSETSTGPAE